MNRTHPLVIKEKAALSPAELAAIDVRLALPIHAHDEGPSRVWSSYTQGLYAFFDPPSGQLVALVEAWNEDPEQASPGWWVDSAFRGQGYGADVVDLLATELKARGVKRIGRITIATHEGEFDTQSARLVRRLRDHFGAPR